MAEPTAAETLHETLQRKAEEWSIADLEVIVAGLREQRDRWNLEQMAGSRKRVTSAQIGGEPKQPKPAKPKKQNPLDFINVML